jgi:flagellar hook protein FlgE
MSALQTGVTGMLAHQLRMDAVGNNIANSNTIGFKGVSVMFADALYQQMESGSVGQGVLVAGIDTNFAQGSLLATGRTTDIAIEGEGFLAVTDGTQIYYTRNGAMGLDAEGNLIHLASGLRVVGLPPSSGSPNTSVVTPSSTLTLPLGQTSVARATSQLNLGGNLDSRAATGTAYQVTARVYDSLGAGHDVTLTFTRSSTPGQWDVSGSSADGAITFASPAQVTFDQNGKPTIDTLSCQMTLSNPAGANSTLDITLSVANMNQLAEDSSTALRSQDGMPPGMLTGIAIAPDGAIMGVYSNGLTSPVGQLVTATFANTGGLENMRDSLFQASPSSGVAVFGAPGSNGRGTVRSGQLESSNVNLAQEFADMIITQRGFQASSRVINTADEMLQELMNVAQ